MTRRKWTHTKNRHKLGANRKSIQHFVKTQPISVSVFDFGRSQLTHFGFHFVFSRKRIYVSVSWRKWNNGIRSVISLLSLSWYNLLMMTVKLLLMWSLCTLYKRCTVASATFKYVVPRLTSQHEGAARVMTFQPRDNMNVARTTVFHLFCHLTNYEHLNNIFTFYLIKITENYRQRK